MDGCERVYVHVCVCVQRMVDWEGVRVCVCECVRACVCACCEREVCERDVGVRRKCTAPSQASTIYQRKVSGVRVACSASCLFQSDTPGVAEPM